jgi:cation transport ATPase
MGTGTDVAIESAMITLVKGDLHGIVKAQKLSQSVMRNIKQTCFSHSSTTYWAFPSQQVCYFYPSAYYYHL